MPARYFLSLVMWITLGIPLFANEGISFNNAIIRQPLGSQDFTAAYVNITNHRNTQLNISGADAPWTGKIEFHETVITHDRTSMRPLLQLVVVQKATLHMDPGNIHIMLFRLKLNSISNPTITFVTADGESLPVSFEIKSIETVSAHETH